MTSTAQDSSADLDLASIRHLYPFNTARLDVPGGAISYVDEGVGPPVVMVHGNPTWSLYYRHLIAALRGSHRVIVPDHMGCGLSDKPQDYPYRLADHIDNLTRLIDHLDLGPVDLVVHDWGGAIGMGWATRHPDLVRRIVVLNTAAFLSPRLPLRIAVCRVPVLGDIALRGMNAFAGAATFMAVERPMPADLRMAYLLPYNSWQNRIAQLRFVQDIPLHPSHPTWAVVDGIDRDLAALRGKPMQILWGGKDWCFNDHFLAGWLQRFPKAMAARFDYAGHYVLEDAHAEIVPRVVRFFEVSS
ncbi:alpha/beta fold hydrolase [Chloroflexales bacterium ZM16-3]|nr:alpha/beta fold hydrolase [Chloroflexales bacterium ZM16-3]